MPPPNARDGLNTALSSPEHISVSRFRADWSALVSADDTSPVLIALSGGTDSLALLLLAHAAFGNRCRAATVDHGLRAEAAAEARFAADVCAKRGVDHTTLTAALPERIGRSANISTRARALRYQLLQQHAERTGASWIATAHHADDQLETVLMRLNRGAGVGGVAAIRSSGWRVVRPLLAWRRAELAAIVAGAELTPIDDPTNRDDRFDRARLRKELGEAGWLDPVGLATSTAALAEADEALIWTTQRLASERIIEVGDTVTLDVTGIPAELIRRLVRICVRRINPKAGPDGPSYARLIDGLVRGRAATIGDVAVSVYSDRWHFRPAPPRRNT